MGNVGVDIILPLFGVMAAGYLAGRFRMLNGDGSALLSRFVMVVALPALIFISLARMPVADFFHWRFLGALGGGMLATFGLGLLVARLAFPDSLTAHGLHALTAMYSSTGYIGLPIVMMAFGDDALIPGIIGTVITGAVFLPLAIVLAEFDRGRGRDRVVLAPLLDVLRSPLLLATAAGLAASAIGFAPPQAIVAFCEILSGAFIPCSLFAAGLFMAGRSVGGEAKEVGWLVCAKLAIHPAITWWLAYKVFALEGILPAVAVLQAALPCGVPVFALAQQYKTFEVRSSAAIVLSTALSVGTLSALLLVLVP